MVTLYLHIISNNRAMKPRISALLSLLGTTNRRKSIHTSSRIIRNRDRTVSTKIPLSALELPLRNRIATILSRDHSSSESTDLLDFSQVAARDVPFFKVVSGFATVQEEQSILKEIPRALRGRRYQYDHWDGAIEGYRETEKSDWMEENRPLINKLHKITASSSSVDRRELDTINEVHVLDLAPDGEIKPHIDSVKFCGEVIVGVSFLSSCVMKMVHEDDPNKWIHALLPRFSLYIMNGVVRFKYTHAIPKGENSVFKGQKISRERRLSIICRTLPLKN